MQTERNARDGVSSEGLGWFGAGMRSSQTTSGLARKLAAVAGTPTVRAGALVALVAMLLTLIFHLNRPQPFIPYHDTFEYVRRADIILSGGSWADVIRLPGYPLLLAGVFAFAGKSNYAAAEGLQNVLFVATSVAVYALAWRIWRDTRLAALVGILFGANLYFFSYFRAILSDGLGALLIAGLALAIVAFLERPGVARFWPVATLCFGALITRGEWLLAPLALFPYLLLVAWRRGVARRLLAHMGAALLVIYGVVVGYMTLNWRVNGYFGLTDATNINLYGKITQYGMQALAPPRFASMAAATERYTQRGVIDPWAIYWRDHALAGRYFTHMGAYAQAIILRHPVEFAAQSLPVAYTSLFDAYVFGGYNHTGALAGLLAAIQSCSIVVYPLFMLFPLCAAVWLTLALRDRRRRPNRSAWIRAEALGALSLLALYALAITTLTSYGEYGRLHIAFDPLMLIVVIGSLVALRGQWRRAAASPQADGPLALSTRLR